MMWCGVVGFGVVWAGSMRCGVVWLVWCSACLTSIHHMQCGGVHIICDVVQRCVMSRLKLILSHLMPRLVRCDVVSAHLVSWCCVMLTCVCFVWCVILSRVVSSRAIYHAHSGAVCCLIFSSVVRCLIYHVVSYVVLARCLVSYHVWYSSVLSRLVLSCLILCRVVSSQHHTGRHEMGREERTEDSAVT